MLKNKALKDGILRNDMLNLVNGKYVSCPRLLMHLSIGYGTVKTIRSVVIHCGLVQIFDLKVFEERKYCMSLVEIVINCTVISMRFSNFEWLRHVAYQY